MKRTAIRQSTQTLAKITLALCVSAGLVACAHKGGGVSEANIERRLSTLESQNRYLQDYVAIWKLQSLYQHYINIGAREEIVALFADHPEVEIELSNKGILQGADAPRRYFLRQSRDDGGAQAASSSAPIPGFMVMHMSVNPALEINGDGSRARAVWLSPGITNLYREGEMKAGWNFGKYEMDYIKQNESWKILAFRWHQIFLTPYDKGWVEENLDPGNVGQPIAPDKPSAPDFYRPYRPDAVNTFDPPPPTPFE